MPGATVAVPGSQVGLPRRFLRVPPRDVPCFLARPVGGRKSAVATHTVHVSIYFVYVDLVGISIYRYIYLVYLFSISYLDLSTYLVYHYLPI